MEEAPGALISLPSIHPLLKRYSDLFILEGMHDYMGLCPDNIAPHNRDALCVACNEMAYIEKLITQALNSSPLTCATDTL